MGNEFEIPHCKKKDNVFQLVLLISINYNQLLELSYMSIRTTLLTTAIKMYLWWIDIGLPKGCVAKDTF